MTDTVLIAGAGHAAGQTAVSLRQQDYDGRIVLIGEEAFIPYQRPPLSKKYLAGELELERLYFRPEKFYREHDVETLLGTRVEKIDREAKGVELDSGAKLGYDKLVLATGSRIRELPVPGTELKGVHYLRNIADVDRIRQDFESARRLVVVGGGYIGLEVAAVAAERGLEVTVLETEDRVMNRVVAPEISEFFQTMHREAGVRIELGRKVEALRGDGRIEAAVCDGGFVAETDLCIIGIGIVPNEELASEAGLPCDNGILVDEFCRTADPDILAVGDCTRHPNALLERKLRLESVHNAIEQGKTAAHTICGTPEPYNQVPWFWSDQYDVKLQIVGLSTGYDQLVIRGEPSSREFAAFYLRDGRLLAVDAVNSPREFMLAKKLVAAGACFDPAELGDMQREFKPLALAALGK